MELRDEKFVSKNDKIFFQPSTNISGELILIMYDNKHKDTSIYATRLKLPVL